MKLKIGIALSVIVLVCCIISFALPWYQIDKRETKITKEVVVQYSWKKFSCQIDGDDKLSLNYDDDDVNSNYIATKACVTLALVNPFNVDNVSKILNSSLSFLKLSLNYDDDDVNSNYIATKACVTLALVNPFNVDNVSKILNSSLSFLVIASALALGTALLQLILLLSPKLCRSCIWKLLCIGCSIATIVMLFISFFTFLGAPKAFKDDTEVLGVNLQGACEDRWCDRIIGNDDDFKWIPGGGWWSCLAGCFTALCAGIFTLASHR
ncbi:hypothetical protein ACTA71_001271 [Dictyostelium dimigraforme]